jgi:hypothetical protein
MTQTTNKKPAPRHPGNDLSPAEIERALAWGAAVLGIAANHAPETATSAASRLAAMPQSITPEMVDAEIADEAFHTFPGSALTVCALTLRNRYTVTGESACVDPAAFNADLGRDLAKGKAREKVFQLLAFRLADARRIERMRANLETLSASARQGDDAIIAATLKRCAQ